MTLFSLAHASRCLGIDTKTLHRWLTEAHLPLHPHPQDARKHAITLAQLEQLAHLHQRSLPFASSPSPLPSELLLLPTLTQQLDALQAHLIALQQQVADLTLLLRQPPPTPSQPASTQASSKARSTTKPRATFPKKPAKPVPVIPRVEYTPEGRYVILCPKQGLLPFAPDSPEWFAWVRKQDSFRFVGKQGHFSAHHEWRVPHGAWRAHRHLRNHVRTVRLAPNQELTIAVLEQAAQQFQDLLSLH